MTTAKIIQELENLRVDAVAISERATTLMKELGDKAPAPRSVRKLNADKIKEDLTKKFIKRHQRYYDKERAMAGK